MQIPVIKQNYSYTDSDIFLQKVVKILCVLYNINLSRGATSLLGYYMMYGFSKPTEYKFIQNKGVKNIWSVYNLRRELKLNEIIVENESTGKKELDGRFNIPLEHGIGMKFLMNTDEFKNHN